MDANQSLSTNTKLVETSTQQSITTTSIYLNVTNENEIETTPSYESEIGYNKIDILNGLNVENVSTETQTKEKSEETVPEITIREIIPEVKEIPITGPPKREIILTNIDDNIHNNDLLDSDTESSEILESYQPPPVLRIGDKLLFLKKGEFVPEKDVSTPSPVITIIGAEGLQRGFEESLENHEFVINENLDKNNSASDDDDVVGSESVIIEEKILPTKETNPKREINVRPKNTAPTKEHTSTKATLTDDNLTSIDIDNTTIDIAVEIPTLPASFVEDASPSTNSELLKEYTTTESYILSLTESRLPTTKESFKEVEEYHENPEYPPIPDAMNSPNNEEHTEHLEQIKQFPEAVTITPKILQDILAIRSNKTIINATNSEWLKSHKVVGLMNEAAILDDEILKQVAPSDYEFTTEETTEKTSQLEKKTEPDSVEENIARLVAKYSTLTQAVEKLKISTKPATTENNAKIVTTISGISSEAEARSTETLENTSPESMESTTPGDNPESVSSTENASVLSKSNSSTTTPKPQLSTTIPTKTSNKFDLKDMVEMLPENPPVKTIPKDISVIEASSTPQLHENKIKKRTNDDPDDIFKELNQELDILENPDKFAKNPDDEKEEAEQIFKELLEEVDGKRKLDQANDNPGLQKVNNVIAKYKLKDSKQSLDTSLLGILREFINSQIKYNQE